MQEVSSALLTLLFRAAIGPCLSVVGYTVGLETFHVSQDGTSALFDPFYHHNVRHTFHGLQVFE